MWSVFQILGLDPVAKPSDPLARPGTGRDAPANGRCGELGEEGLIERQSILAFAVDLLAQAALLQHLGQAAREAPEDAHDLGVFGRWEREEARPFGSIEVEHAVEREDVEVNVEERTRSWGCLRE